jgi:hypothetical protein
VRGRQLVIARQKAAGVLYLPPQIGTGPAVKSWTGWRPGRRTAALTTDNLYHAAIAPIDDDAHAAAFVVLAAYFVLKIVAIDRADFDHSAAQRDFARFAAADQLLGRFFAHRSRWGRGRGRRDDRNAPGSKSYLLGLAELASSQEHEPSREDGCSAAHVRFLMC